MMDLHVARNRIEADLANGQGKKFVWASRDALDAVLAHLNALDGLEAEEEEASKPTPAYVDQDREHGLERVVVRGEFRNAAEFDKDGEKFTVDGDGYVTTI